MMFKAVNEQQLSDTGPQLDRVLEFRKQMDGQNNHHADSFDTIRRCRLLMRWHLADWARGQDSGAAGNELMLPAKAPSILSLEGIDETGKARALDQLERPNESLTARAWALADEGRLTEAEVEFANVVTEHQQLETLVSYGIFLCGAGRLEQAKSLMERAVQISEERGEGPSLADTAFNLGIVLEVLEDPEGAVRMYRKSLETAERLGLVPHIAKVTALLENLGGSVPE